MGITHVQHGADSTGAGTAATVAVTLSAITPGNLVVIHITGSNFTGVTDNLSNVYSEAVTFNAGARQYYLKNCPNAPITFTASFSPNTANLAILVHEVNGPSLSYPFLLSNFRTQTAPGTAANAVTSNAISPSQNGVYIMGVAADTSSTRNAPSFTAGTSPNVYTKAAQTGTFSVKIDVESEYLIQSSAASIEATFTYNQAADNAETYITAWGTPETHITGLGQKHMGFNYARPYL